VRSDQFARTVLRYTNLTAHALDYNLERAADAPPNFPGAATPTLSLGGIYQEELPISRYPSASRYLGRPVCG